MEFTNIQKQLLQEMIQQGEREDIACHLTRILKMPFQQQAMMKYLISIRQEYVSEVEVIQMAQRLSEMKD